jgi:hypothetical protein
MGRGERGGGGEIPSTNNELPERREVTGRLMWCVCNRRSGGWAVD